METRWSTSPASGSLVRAQPPDHQRRTSFRRPGQDGLLSSATSGARPRPEPISTRSGRVRTCGCSRPCGPSVSTLVPALHRATRAPSSPWTAMVMRRPAVLGAAENDMGCPRVHPGPVRSATRRTGRRRRAALEVPPGQVDLDDVRPDDVDPRRDEPVVQAHPQGRQDPEDDDARRGHRPQRPPVRGRHGGGEEVRAGPQLMGQGEPDAEVGVQVQQVPRLVPQPAPRGAHRGDRQHGEQHRAGQGDQHPRVGDDQLPELVEHVPAVHPE